MPHPTDHPTEETERGSVTLFVAVIALGLLLAVGLVVDGGRKLGAIEQAQFAATDAARAAGQQIDVATATGAGVVSLDPSAATAAAQSTLDAAGVIGTVTLSGDTLTVTATATRPTALMSVVGVGSVSGSSTVEVRLVQVLNGGEH